MGKAYFKYGFFLILLGLVLSTISCGGDEIVANGDELVGLESVNDEKWEKLFEKRIYFGHQSVGSNIVDGMSEVLDVNQNLRLNFKKTDNLNNANGGIFAHSFIGINMEPISKINDFNKIIKKNARAGIDIAFMKFCFIDINLKTDVTDLFKKYKKNMSLLKKKYPHIIFVHLTVPIMAHPQGFFATLKEVVKKVLGKAGYGFEANLKRCEFNELMRHEYKNREPLFDLAFYESVRKSGERLAYLKNGKKLYALLPEYTDDGGHLNLLGQKFLAENLLIFLAKL